MDDIKLPLKIIAGPCVLDDLNDAVLIARDCRRVCDEFGMEYWFKASFDKANRTELDSYRGPGLHRGLNMLADIKEEVGVKVLTDIHTAAQAQAVSDIVDVVQIPAMLCRQTDLIQAAALHSSTVNIKKGQFADIKTISNAVDKAKSATRSHVEVWVTERGSCFGKRDLVVDFRNLSDMKVVGKTIFDASHSATSIAHVWSLARAAVAVGVDGIFVEVHPNPKRAKCDGKTSIKLDLFKEFITDLMRIENALW